MSSTRFFEAAALVCLLAMSGCADVSPGTASLCGGVTCPTGTICLLDECRDPNENANNDASDDVGGPMDAESEPDTGEDEPDIVSQPDAEPPDVPDNTPDTGEDEPCEGCQVLVEPEVVSITVSQAGQVVERRLTLLNVGPRSTRVLAVFVDNPALELLDNLEGTVLEAEGGRTEFRVQYTAPDLASVSTQIRVLVDIPQTLTVPVEVVGKLGNDPCIEVLPTTVAFGQVQRGTLGTRQVRVSNCGSSDLDITRLERGSFFGIPTPDSFQWQMTPAEPTTLGPADMATIEVTYTPGRRGLDLGFFNIHNSDPAEPIVRVDLSAQATPPPIEEQDLHIQLEWDSDNCDVDLHFLSADDDIFTCPQTCFYANPAPDWGTQGDWQDDPFLDYDNIVGLGPENINVQSLQPGRYLIALHYYLDSYEDSDSTDTNATVRVYFRGQLAGTYGPQHLDHTGRMWDVVQLDWPARTLTPLGRTYEVPHRACR